MQPQGTGVLWGLCPWEGLAVDGEVPGPPRHPLRPLCPPVLPPRLNLRELGPWASHMRWLVWIMASVGTVYVFFFHER